MKRNPPVIHVVRTGKAVAKSVSRSAIRSKRVVSVPRPAAPVAAQMVGVGGADASGSSPIDAYPAGTITPGAGAVSGPDLS